MGRGQHLFRPDRRSDAPWATFRAMQGGRRLHRPEGDFSVPREALAKLTARRALSVLTGVRGTPRRPRDQRGSVEEERRTQHLGPADRLTQQREREQRSADGLQQEANVTTRGRACSRGPVRPATEEAGGERAQRIARPSRSQAADGFAPSPSLARPPPRSSAAPARHPREEHGKAHAGRARAGPRAGARGSLRRRRDRGSSDGVHRARDPSMAMVGATATATPAARGHDEAPVADEEAEEPGEEGLDRDEDGGVGHGRQRSAVEAQPAK